MKSTYLIFIDPLNAYNHIKITCEPEKFIDELLYNELLTTKDEFELVNWVIYKDGDLIK